MKLAVLADLHLGCRHLNSDEREQDFYEAFETTKWKLLELKPDVLLIAGDLFHDRQLRPETLTIARENLEAFRRASIPVYIVPGNHDRAMYSDKKTWLEVLEDQGLIHVLGKNGDLEEVQIGDGCSLVGMPFAGHREREVLQSIFDLPKPKVEHRFLLCHIGVAEVKPGIPGCVSAQEMDSLHKEFDAIFTGHFHSPWDNGFVYCPGALGYTSVSDEPGGFVWYETGAGTGWTYPLESYYPLRQVVTADLADIDKPESDIADGAIWRVEVDQVISRQEVEKRLSWAKPLRVLTVYHPGIQLGPGLAQPQAVDRASLEMHVLVQEMGDAAPLGYQVLQSILQGAEVDEVLEMVYQAQVV